MLHQLEDLSKLIVKEQKHSQIKDFLIKKLVRDCFVLNVEVLRTYDEINYSPTMIFIIDKKIVIANNWWVLSINSRKV